jgi:hypothetical protein
MPVIVSGPEYATGVQWGRANSHACVTVNTGPTDELRIALQRLANEADYRCGLAFGALDAAVREFAPEAIEAAFEQRLRQITNGPEGEPRS